MIELLNEWRNIEAQSFRLIRDKCRSYSESDEDLYSEEYKKIEELYNNIDEHFFSYILQDDINKNSLIIEFSNIYIKLKEIKSELNKLIQEYSLDLKQGSEVNTPEKIDHALNEKNSPEELANNIETIKESFKRKIVKPGVKSSKKKFYDTKLKSLIKEIWASFPMINEINSYSEALGVNERYINVLSDIKELDTIPYYSLLFDYKSLKGLMLRWTEWLINHPFKCITNNQELFPPILIFEESFMSFNEVETQQRNRINTELSGSTKAEITPKDLFFMNKSYKQKTLSIHQTELDSLENKATNEDRVYDFDSQLVLTKFNFKLLKTKASIASTEKSIAVDPIPIDSSKCVMCNIF